MARRLIGTGTTDSNGRISINYTGVGAGKLQLVAVSGNLTSEVHELIDAKYIQTGKTTGWYNTTLTLENNRLKWVYNSSNNQYASLRGSSISDLIGTTFNVNVKIASEKAVGLAVYWQENTDWNNEALLVITDNLEHTISATIPSNATTAWIRLQTSQNSLQNDDVIYIDKFIVY